MLDGSKLIMEQLNIPQNKPVDTHVEVHALNPPSKSSYEDLFTPPDFLAECRKFIESSNKKHHQTEEQEWQDPAIPDEPEPNKKITFSNLLGDSRNKIPQTYTNINQIGFNEVISENASLNISSKKPESEVQFQFRHSLIHGIEELLL